MTDRKFNSDKFRWLNSVCSDPAVSSTSFRVAYAIADHLNKTTRNAWPSQQRIARRFGCHQKTVQRAIKELEGLGWLKVRRRRDGLTSNRYEIAWPFGTQDDDKPVETATNDGNSLVQQSDQECPGGGGKNDPQSYSSKLPRIFSRSASEEKRYPRFIDRGNYEQQIVARLGTDGHSILNELEDMDPRTVERMCRAQQRGVLTQLDLDAARLAVLHRTKIRTTGTR
jgi:hypothetical protein